MRKIISFRELKVTAIIAVILSLALILATAKSSEAEEPFGYIHTQFSLNDFGYDTAGSNDPDINYFHTMSGIEVRDRNGNLLEVIDNPAAVYGLAFSDGKLYASTGSEIYGYLGGNLWDAGLGLENPRPCRGLAAPPYNFVSVCDNGAGAVTDLLIRDKQGKLQNTFDLSPYLPAGAEGYGVGWSPFTNEIGISYGGDDILRLFFDANFTTITDWEIVQLSGMGADSVIGVGYNKASGDLVLNDMGDSGAYAYGQT